MISGSGIETYPTLMFVAMSGSALVVGTRSTVGEFVGIKSICTKIFASELRPGKEPRNLVLLALLSGDGRRLGTLTGLVGLLVTKEKTGNTPSPHQRDRYSPRNRDQDRRRTPSARGEAPRRPRSTSPGAPAIDACRDFTRGYCSRGQECKFAHTRSGSSDAKRKERPPLIPGYCAQWISYGKCLRDKCDYKHAKPPEHLLKDAGKHTAAPATESADAQPESAEPTSTADDRTYSPAPDLSAGF